MSASNELNIEKGPAFESKLWSGSVIFLLSGLIALSVLMTSHIFERQELLSINHRFESRMWLLWSPQSLSRLNPVALWAYHEAHETPRSWYSWDQTLSWLIKDNHPAARNKFVIFNRVPEDEPPIEAVESHPWMRPLTRYPLPRKTMGEIVAFLADNGARLIVLDNDFPQYSDEDADLARAIHDASKSGVPVLFARTVSKRSSPRFLMIEEPTMPRGLLRQLARLEPGVDVASRYTGMPGAVSDLDQVVRQAVVSYQDASGNVRLSLAAKALARTDGIKLESLPEIVDIDFSSPPSSALYPIRPLWYLLDPQTQDRMTGRTESGDVTLDGAIVVIGDGVVDTFNTPLSNVGVDQMSGSEVLVHTMETLGRRQWPVRLDGTRLDGLNSFLYGAFVLVAGALVWWLWKKAISSRFVLTGQEETQTARRGWRVTVDCLVLVLLITGSYMVSLALFSFFYILTPIVVPSIALAFGGLTAVLWEKEKEREDLYNTRLEAATEKLELQTRQHEEMLKRREAETRERELVRDQLQKKEFARRINHDLNAPVSVLNWTLVELRQSESLADPEDRGKVDLLVRNSDRLCELIDELVHTYDQKQDVDADTPVCELVQLVDDCVDLQRPVVEIRGSTIVSSLPADSLIVRARSLNMARVVDNLIRNAIKHNEAGIEIRVSVRREGERCFLKVDDNGGGIEPQVLDKVFEPGFSGATSRPGDSSLDRHAGQGLGLDIVRNLIEEAGGTITVDSTVGKGTSFRITLPLADDSRAPEKSVVREEAPDSMSKNAGDRAEDSSKHD